MPVLRQKIRKRALLWAELNALEQFYDSCPDNRTWVQHMAWYKQAYREILRRKKELMSIYF